MKPLHQILSFLLIALLLSSCYHSISSSSSRIPNGEELRKEIEVSWNQPQDNRNYKVILKNGDTHKFCNIDRIQDDVVFFNKLIKKNGEEFYEPHGFYIKDIRQIKYWDGTTFDDVMLEILDSAIEEM